VLSKTILTKKMFKIWSKTCDIRRVAETKCVGTQLHDSEVFLVYIYIYIYIYSQKREKYRFYNLFVTRIINNLIRHFVVMCTNK
jgi:hypothetical protein